MTATERACERIKDEAVASKAYQAGRFWCGAITAQANEDDVIYQTAHVFVSADLALGCVRFLVDTLRRAA